MSPRSLEKLLWLENSIGSLARRIACTLWYTISFLPDEEILWRSIHRPRDQLRPSGEVKPSFFRDRTGLSCDLSRFSTVEHSRRDPPPESGLVELSVVSVRKVGSDVCHVPTRDPRTNYAHCQFSVHLGTEEAEDLLALSSMRIRHSFKGYGDEASSQLPTRKDDR